MPAKLKLASCFFDVVAAFFLREHCSFKPNEVLESTIDVLVSAYSSINMYKDITWHKIGREKCS